MDIIEETCICGKKYTKTLDSKRLYCSRRTCKNKVVQDKQFRERKMKKHVQLKVKKIKSLVTEFIETHNAFYPFREIVTKFTNNIVQDELYVFSRKVGVLVGTIIYYMGNELGVSITLIELAELLNVSIPSISRTRKLDKQMFEASLTKTINECQPIANFVQQKSPRKYLLI